MDLLPYYREFGDRVRSARGSRSQAELASLARMTRAAIASVEIGRYRVTLDVLDRIARALDVPAASLLPSIPADPASTNGALPLARRDRAAVERVLAAAGLRIEPPDAQG
jgi:transcriptional regulator with XRE-family HTH domain